MVSEVGVILLVHHLKEKQKEAVMSLMKENDVFVALPRKSAVLPGAFDYYKGKQISL